MWSGSTRVLMIDDDERLATAVSVYLERQGYDVELAHGADEGIAVFHSNPPDIVLLDVMMPVKDGWEICRLLRADSAVPIIMLTARADETDRIHGLRLGADDYVGKPFSLRELEARIEAVLRRSRLAPAPADVLFEDDRLRIDRGTLRVLVDGQVIPLTATERRLLFVLAENPDRVLSPDHILRHVWGPEYVGQADYVKLYVWRVRQKIEPDPAHPIYIHTERGLGYRFHAIAIAEQAASTA